MIWGNCKIRDIILKVIFLELWLFLNLAFFVKSIVYFNVAHYSKMLIKISTPNLECLLIMTRCSCMKRGLTLKAVVFGVMPLFNLEILSKLLIKCDNFKTIKDIKMKLQILAYHEMGQLKDNVHYSEINIFWSYGSF